MPKHRAQANGGFNPRENVFISAYILFNLLGPGAGTKTTIKAGYNRKNARFQASRMLTKANIRAEIASRARALVDRHNETVRLGIPLLMDAKARALHRRRAAYFRALGFELPEEE